MVQIQLSWTEAETGLERQPLLEAPVALGREFDFMPSEVDGKPVSRMVLTHEQVDNYHALIQEQEGKLWIRDQGSRAGTKVNGVSLPYHQLRSGDRIQIGPFEIQVQLPAQGNLQNNWELVSPAIAPPSPAVSSTAAIAGVASGSASMTNSEPFGPDGTCDRMVGFLFKRRCGRTTTEGCPHCRNGQVAADHDPYFYDYNLYPGYGYYGHGHWGHSYYSHRDRYFYNADNRSVDFTEADAAALEAETDTDYEMDLEAS